MNLTVLAISAPLYKTETQVSTNREGQRDKIQITEMKFLMAVKQYTRLDKIKNEEI